MRILVTGAAGFVAGYLISELLDHEHEVVGVDDLSKYGPVARSYDDHPGYRFVRGDATDVEMLRSVARGCDQIVAAAAMIGGISYFHRFAYDLIAANERIVAATFDAALHERRTGTLQRIIVVSSSMVYESCAALPTKEGDQLRCPPPRSTYGFQKLATEYFAVGAHQQYGLPYTIVRPFNCVGIGERRALVDRALSGDRAMALSHVVPDLVRKVMLGQDPLHLLGDGDQVRHFTYGGDLARGIRLAMESEAAVNEDFNLSTAVGTRIVDLARMIWERINGDRPFSFVSEPSFEHDVQLRIPSVEKARRVLGFEATTPLSSVLDEVVPWMRDELAREAAPRS